MYYFLTQSRFFISNFGDVEFHVGKLVSLTPI